jgi:LCP family protein required for cell wall assembly
VLIVTNIFVALSLVSFGAVYAYVRYRASQLKTISLPGLTAGSGGVAAMNILLVGSNTRTGLDPSEASQFGSASDVSGARSDVTMILHLEPGNGSASLLSIPRDLFVPLPPHSMSGSVGKIDAALNDGPNNLITAITDDLGIPINHYVEVNFDGFRRTIDAVGGISMSFSAPLRDSFSGLNITAPGCQHLTGKAALAVVRARHLQYYADGRWNDDPLSDLARIRRDHTFLKIFVATAKSQLTNPLRVNALAGGLLNQVTVDSGLNVNSLLGLLRRYRHLNPDTLPETTLPITVVPGYHYGSGSYGDVDMPVEPLDHQVISDWQGHPLRPAAPSSIGVQVVNISGNSRKASMIGQQLGALGYHLAGTGTAPIPARTTETLIRYHPGSVSQALGVLQSLSGAIMMKPDPAVMDGKVILEVGSVVAVLATPSTPASPGQSATTTSPSRQPAATTSTVPTAGGLAPSSSVDHPASYDPVAC